MNPSAHVIPLGNLALAFAPVAVMLAVMFAWSLQAGRALYGVARMLVQLLLIGYILTFIFESNRLSVVLGVLGIMVVASSWIALSNTTSRKGALFWSVMGAIAIAGGGTLAVTIASVLQPEPWYSPRFVIPLAGMVFANAMNTISVTAERLGSELRSGASWLEARNTALHAGLIPVVNSLFAVGLVSLPGMMTGQILSGISPLIAVRYQIMVMCMIFGGGGLAAALFLVLSRRVYERGDD
ncbi:MAG: ABC transporter permease [Proteobacteria bacterium]|nr:MAG: ABC transporter permease [Pseudomonadota bacterium]